MKRSYITAAVLAAAAIAWVASGQLGDRGGAPVAQKPPALLEADKQRPKVRVRRQVAEEWAAEVVLRGRTEAERIVEIRAETEGRVIALNATDGAKVEAEQIVVRLDPDERPAMIEEAEALLEQRVVEYDAARKLTKKGFRSATALAGARAALESAEAALSQARDELSNTDIEAPFSGLIDDHMVEIGDFVKEGDPILRLVDLDPIIIVAQVTERNMGRLSMGTRGRAKLLTGQEVEGELRFMGAIADPTTRTFRVEMEVENPGGRIPDGATAELRIPTKSARAHRVSPAVLTLSDRGLIGVKALSTDNRVAFHPVEILENGPEGMWLGGLPEEFTLITVGQEFVTEGQEVEPVDERSLQGDLQGGGTS
ncbi:MAG: efflux RND transporter periplasmic adaptor subunit [Kiloniellales bacterium]|nr:efflux RND transporter periplasmic adaptor subunit [Kiloniellales bacterium]